MATGLIVFTAHSLYGWSRMSARHLTPSPLTQVESLPGLDSLIWRGSLRWPDRVEYRAAYGHPIARQAYRPSPPRKIRKRHDSAI